MAARNVFQINPISRFDNKNVTMKRPKEFACFSYDDQHQYIPDDSSLKYYYPPTIGADLCQGFDNFQKFDESSDRHLDSILKAIIDYEKKSDSRIESDFVTWRGMMTKLAGAVYSNRDGFEMNATLFQVESRL
ncbi:BgTH12-01996 [Blumeria graminis f. sp. triticale]|uniref:Decapping nuclease n=1 Tax=Blumeria graminis f. sp. triticale TaxID=1689686 RepID=A0A9W4D0K6_BLUGR|nr:BgTH12-01996 [Blumeria graminis f. sp. triticale]